MTSNNKLPRLENNASTRHSFMGGLFVVLGIVLLISGIVIGLVIYFTVGVWMERDLSLPAIMLWIVMIVGIWLIHDGMNRMVLNSTFRRLRVPLEAGALSIQELADNVGSTPKRLLDDIAMLLRGKYWKSVEVTDKALVIIPFAEGPYAKIKLHTIGAEEGMRFSGVFRHNKMPHTVVAAILIALLVLLPLPFNNTIWVLAGIVLSFPLRRFFNLLMPKGEFIEYTHIPEYIPEKIVVEMSGNEQADELIDSGKNYLEQLQDLEFRIKDPQLNSSIKEITAGVNQVLKVLRENPIKHRKVRQTFDYTIPTTIKLFYKYIELESQPVQGENIKASIAKIHEMSKLVSSTFTKEVDNLYQDQSLDIEVDVEVMRNILQQETLELLPSRSNNNNNKTL